MHWSTPLKQEWLIRYRNPLTQRFGREFFLRLPKGPGVYRFYGRFAGEADILLYVGKAKSLRERLASYRQANPDSVSRKVLWMLGQVRRIELETCASERAALLRENELLRTLRPPFNVLNTSPESYVFIALHPSPQGIRFRVTSQEPDGFSEGTSPRGERFFGAFKSRGAVRQAYGALLRLLWMATEAQASERYEIPAILHRYKPPSPYTLPHGLPRGWEGPLESFLGGRSRRLLRVLTQALLEQASIPAYLYPRVQEDLETLADFFAQYCARNRRLCRHFGSARSWIPQAEIDDWTVMYHHDRKERNP